MYNLSCFLGRKNAAGGKKLAAFFLLSLICTFSVFSQNTRPFSTNGKLYFLNSQNDVTEIIALGQGKFLQRGVSSSGKKGCVLAWEQKTQQLLHINENGKVTAAVQAPANSVFLSKKYILMQSSSWTENRGFEFTLSKINYAKLGTKITLKKQWSGFIDCFVSDCVFTENGVCISGGTKDNSTHNVYSISLDGIHKCFSMPKNSDFLRLVPNPTNETELFAFVSQREKIAVTPSFYSFDLNTRTDNTTATKYVLSDSEKFPSGFECFFGYGFTLGDDLILPCSVDKSIVFVKYSPAQKKIVSVTSDVVGCNFPLFESEGLFYYIAKDPLSPEDFYGIATYNGKTVNKVVSFE